MDSSKVDPALRLIELSPLRFGVWNFRQFLCGHAGARFLGESPERAAASLCVHEEPHLRLRVRRVVGPLEEG